MTVEVVIFDFDGVIADSEGLACEVLARYVTELGVPMSRQEALDRFTGKRVSDVTAMVEQLTGVRLPEFAEELQRRTFDAFKTDLREVSGVGHFLESQKGLRRCIASSSAPKRIRFCLSLLQLDRYFGDNIFSADQVARGKPYPDIFLYAARKMGVDSTKAVVIEDSPGGVQAAVSANMRVIGLLAATHLSAGHGERLRAAGATLIAKDYDEVSAIISRL
jgi:HAD superfamily hydrolase (TIGR01509 family)